MGLKIPPLPDDFEMGDDCLHCHEPGLTPNYVFIRFWDVTPCPGKAAPPNGYCFVCKQGLAAPCEYYGFLDFGGITWRAYYDMHAPIGEGHRAEISLGQFDPPAVAAFFGWTDACGVVFDTNMQSCPGDGGEGGRAIVTIFADPIIIALTSAYHFATIPGILYDFADCGMDHRWYRICHKIDHTNIMIYLDKEHIEYD
ncbi:hypothetical protein ES703_67892 [subsurface metagenome]